MAWVYLKLGERENAWAALRRGAKLDVHAAFVGPVVALELGDREVAHRLADNMFSIPYTYRGGRPSRRTELYLRGRLALADSRSAEAVAYLKEALRHRPLSWSIESYEDGLADALLSLRQWDAAITEYKRILEINPNWAIARFHLAQTYDGKGDQARALIEYKRFVDVWHDADRDLPLLVAARKRLTVPPDGQ